MSEGRTLELFFINGNPDGMLTATVFNWTGHFLVAPRKQIRKALERPEARQAGVYILLGDKGDKPMVYVGEGENISERIRNHDKGKDWWDKVYLITSSADDLNKAHIKYLEACLIQEAQEARRVKLENNVTPEPGGLTEAARSSMNVFLDYVLMVLPALKVDYFANNRYPTSNRDRVEGDTPIFVVHSSKHNLRAKLRLVDGAFIVEKGSQARYQWEGTKNWDSTYRRLHADLIENGVIVEVEGGDPRRRVFGIDYAFQSPSAAAAVVLGRSAGRSEWKVQATGKTYGEWLEEQLS